MRNFAGNWNERWKIPENKKCHNYRTDPFTTPWSAVFGNLLKASNLRDSSRGRGVQPTWPARLPLFWIPIDHFLHSPELQVISKRTGPAVGSDHLPLLIEFNLKHKTNNPPLNGPLFDSSLN